MDFFCSIQSPQALIKPANKSCHQNAPLLKEGLVIIAIHVHELLWHTVFGKVFLEVICIGDSTILQLAVGNLLLHFCHVHAWCIILDIDVDFRLRIDVISNLIVVPAVVDAVLLKIPLRENMVNVATLLNQR